MNNQEYEMDNNNNNNNTTTTNNNNTTTTTTNNNNNNTTTTTTTTNNNNNNEEQGNAETIPNQPFPLEGTIYHRPIVYDISYLFSKEIPPSISAGQAQRQNTTNFQSSLSSRDSRLLQSPPQQQQQQFLTQQQLSVQNQWQPNQQIQQQHPLLGMTNNAFGQHSRVSDQQFWLSQMDNNNNNRKRKNSSNNEEEEEEEDEEEINTNPIPEGKSETIPIPFPWATDHRATIHTLNYLFSKQISSITGEVQCKICKRTLTISYPLQLVQEKFMEIRSITVKMIKSERAPHVLVNPNLPLCEYCGRENSMKPVISDKKRSINWLFLFLGKTLGCCTVKQLKYFCKHQKSSRSGSKDHVLYLTYLGLSKQLDPDWRHNP